MASLALMSHRARSSDALTQDSDPKQIKSSESYPRHNFIENDTTGQ